MATLYVIGRDSFISLESEHIRVERLSSEEEKNKSTRRIPLFDIDRVVLVGRPAVSIAVLQELLRRGVAVSLFSRSGRYHGAFSPAKEGQVLLRIRQYERSCDMRWTLEAARLIVGAKIVNCRRVLQKLKSGIDRDCGEVDTALSELAAIGRRLERAVSSDELLGFEGAGGALYFRALRQFFPEEMPFGARTRRPPRDPVNALLSWVYTITLSEVKAAVIAAGLDPAIGCYHSTVDGRPSLALDLLEPLRPALCDLLTLRLVNLHILTVGDFEKSEDGAWRLTRDGMRKFFLQYEQRMQRAFRERGETQHTSFRMVIRRMAEDFRAALVDLESFRPFIMP